MKNYIIGYGSLINKESQSITGKSLSSMPVVLKNFSRSWTVTYDDLQFCALGVYKKKGSSINVVLFEVEDLQVFDQREHGYNRYELDRNLLNAWFPGDQIPESGKIWIYFPLSEKFGTASDRHFIWQSYVDVILMGCLSIDRKFAEEFIKTTDGWMPSFFKDDRNESAYLKALKTYHAQDVDDVLSDFLRLPTKS
ncbi:MAG: gamma-glutamylcyclotransferase [Bdellovibrionaceae bacterium]|nr:gamma-glutamylcyclotransferase [Pseudobdellovibrionaceae bacterium]